MSAQEWFHCVCWVFDHTNANQAFHVAYRWAHYLSSAAYVGLLLFLNLLLRAPGKRGEPGISRALLEKVFFLFRWAAMLFFFTGLNLLHMLYNFPTGNYFSGDKGLWMAVGAGLGTLSWALIWFWIGPAQRRHFEAWERSGSPGQALGPRSASGVRWLTALLPSLMMGMAVGGHGVSLLSWGWWDVACVFGLGSGSVLAYYAWAARAPKEQG